MKAIAATSEPLARMYIETFDLGTDWKPLGIGAALTGWKFEKIAVAEWAEVRAKDVQWLNRLICDHLDVDGKVYAL